MIMAMLLVRSAPGVSAMSWRLMRAVGVTVLTLAVLVSVVTVTACCTAPSCSSKCRMGEVSEASARVCRTIPGEGGEITFGDGAVWATVGPRGGFAEQLERRPVPPEPVRTAVESQHALRARREKRSEPVIHRFFQTCTRGSARSSKPRRAPEGAGSAPVHLRLRGTVSHRSAEDREERDDQVQFVGQSFERHTRRHSQRFLAPMKFRVG